MKAKTRRYDVVSYLETQEDMAHYLEAALEDGDATFALSALGDVARALGIREISKQTGIPLEDLKPAFSRTDEKDAETVLKVARALGSKAASVPLKTRMSKTVARVRPSVKRTKSKAS